MSVSAHPQLVTETDRRSHMQARIQHCTVLPTLPDTIAPILTLVDDIHTSLADLEDAITRDISCAVRLLQVANSAFYGASHKITSIRRAILLLGFNPIKRIASSLPIFDSFLEHNPVEMATITALWQHSHAVARLSRRIAHDVPSLDPELAFCAGLLHDLGRVVLLHLCPAAYQQCLAQIERNPGCHASQVERDVLGVTHVEAGLWLAETWHLPAPMPYALANHHHPQTLHPLVMTIMLADAIINTQPVGRSDGQRPVANPRRLARGLNLTPRHLAQYAIYMQAEAEARQRPAGRRS